MDNATKKKWLIGGGIVALVAVVTAATVFNQGQLFRGAAWDTDRDLSQSPGIERPVDTDKDLITDDQDNCPKTANPLQENIDRDELGDACELPDEQKLDRDQDGILDSFDNCVSVANPIQENADGDEFGDACEVDTDKDLVIDDKDNCPTIANPDQKNGDDDRMGDACDLPTDQKPDRDGDGITDDIDNCFSDVNPRQENADKDALGDACDPTPNGETTAVDTDKDGYNDDKDNCPTKANRDQLNADGDKYGNVCDNCPTVSNDSQADADGNGIGDACEPKKEVPPKQDTAPNTVYNYSYNYYTSPDQPAATGVTQPTTSPCVVGDKTFYLAGGPNSAYCKDLQSLLSPTTGTQTVFQSDMTPETPQARYTTALATLRILKELGGNIRTKNLSTDWYNKLEDGETIRKASTQELADFRTVYASGILSGRVNPQDQTQVTLAPLGKVSYIELMAMFRQSIVNSLGVKVEVDEANLPSFILAEYKNNPDWKWIAESYSFGVDYGLISKNEFSEETLFNYSTRADMVRFLARFQDAVESNPALLK